jgi:hypothetical protein
MRIPRIDFSGPTVVVLGAGATRGASFVKPPILPPLDTDFFTQAQRLPSGEQSRIMQKLMSQVTSIFGTNFKLTMEGFFTQIEHLANVFDDYKSQGRPPDNPYRPVRPVFLQVLASVLHEAVGTEPECRYHRKMIERLGSSDAIISFNYDCVVDYNLKMFGDRRWNPNDGYGLACHKVDARHWSPDTPVSDGRSLLLLKMHGSLNWKPYPPTRAGVKLRLKKRWWRQHGDVRFEIVPPEWNKETIRRGVYKAVWRRARERIRNCAAIVVIGFSMPVTDLPAQALFRVDAHKARKLKLLVIANPDPEVRRRIRDVFRRRTNPKTRIIVFDNFKDLGSFL